MPKIKKTARRQLLDLTAIALFAALCYILLTVLFIPFANMYIHFGNMVVVLAALLIGGWQGGLAGSIGMGLFDLLNGHADSFPKTFVLKLLIGLTAGAVFSFFCRNKKQLSAALITAGLTSLTLGGALIAYTLIINHAYRGKGAVLAPIFLLLGAFCLIFARIRHRFSEKKAAAVLGAVCGMTVNILGEVVWKWLYYSLAGSQAGAALSAALLDQGSTLINAGIAVFGGTALFLALEAPFDRIWNRKSQGNN